MGLENQSLSLLLAFGRQKQAALTHMGSLRTPELYRETLFQKGRGVEGLNLFLRSKVKSKGRAVAGDEEEWNYLRNHGRHLLVSAVRRPQTSGGNRTGSEHAQRWEGMRYNRKCPTVLSAGQPVSTLEYLL